MTPVSADLRECARHIVARLAKALRKVAGVAGSVSVPSFVVVPRFVSRRAYR